MTRRRWFRPSTIATIIAVAAIVLGIVDAVIRSMRVTLPGALGGASHGSWGVAVQRLRAAGADVPAYWNFEGGEALGVQRSRELARVVVPSSAGRDLLDALDRIDVEIVYESVYGEEFSARLR